MSNSKFIAYIKNHRLMAATIFTLFGFVASVKTLQKDAEVKQRRHEGIFKDRDRLNRRRIANGLPPLPDNEFRDEKLVQEWLEFKKDNNIKY